MSCSLDLHRKVLSFREKVIEKAKESGMEVVIPLKKNRKIQRRYDKALCKHRHLLENTFLHLKCWRGMTTRYAKKSFFFSHCCTNPLYCFVGSYLMTILSGTKLF